MAKLAGKHVVVGLGKTGLSCVRFLTRLGCDVVVVDTRAEPPGKTQLAKEFADIELLTGELDQFKLETALELVVSPGLPLSIPALEKARNSGVAISGDVELFARSVSAPVIAVTGSNGKSTVVTLLGQALEALGYRVCVAGNIGLPVLDALASESNIDTWVLELSSFQLEATHSLRPAVAVSLNVSEDHMDRYDSLDHYAMVKQRIFDNCEAAVYWFDDNRTKPAQVVNPPVAFGGGAEGHGRFYVATDEQGDCLMDGSQVVLRASEVKLKGAHNLLNMAAVLAAITEFGVTDYQAVISVLKSFPGLPHRCQWVAEVDGVQWYNDSKGTNIGAAEAAITGLSASVQRLIWIAGGDGKGADFSVLQSTVNKEVTLAIVYGRDKGLLEMALSMVTQVKVVENLQQAVQFAHKFAVSGDAVLLSPACASLDQFVNYEQRGDQFIRLVKEL